MPLLSVLFQVSLTNEAKSMLYASCVHHYLQGTKRHDIIYVAKEGNMLIGYTYIDCVGSLDDKKRTSVCLLHGHKAIVIWKQRSVALSAKAMLWFGEFGSESI